MLVTTFYDVSFTRITAIAVSLQLLLYGPTFITAAVKGVANAVSQVATIKHGKYLCADARWGGQARYIRALVW